VFAFVAVAGGNAWAQSGGPEPTIRPLLWQRGMAASQIGEVNVFRRFSSERTTEMSEFYGTVLGLSALPSSALGGGQMIRYPVGGSEVKLFPSPPSEANTAPAAALAGVRLLTFFFADEAALAGRFGANGYPVPEFHGAAGGPRRALAQDPDGEWVELVVTPGAPAAELTRFEIGIVAADVEKSRAFYRDFMGLAALPPEHDDLLGAMKYGYRHGATTINVFAGRADLPSDAATAGMQYIVWDVEKIDAVAQERGAKIDRPLSEPGQMRTIWLQDPDGISNYFAQFAGNDNTPPATTR
jgi:catechol 2,3-dioxygenase-like lactoylglutathione lyase family enzyme